VKARENPFASHHIEKLPFIFPAGDSWETFLNRLAACGWRGSIVGSHGSGKTTLLEQLVPRLEERGFEPRCFTLRSESTAHEKRALLDAVRPMRAPEFLLVDGAEQLSTREWLPLHAAAHQCAGSVLTLHRVGRLPVIFETVPSAMLLEQLVSDLSGARLPTGEAAGLFQRHRGDLRACLRELYDRWAG
jgi:hypothetical protein